MALAREDVVSIIREEFPRLFIETPEVKYQLIGMLAETFAERTDLQAVLERIDALREDFNRQFTEHSRRMDAMRKDFNRQFEEFSHCMELFAQRQEEHSRRMEAFAEAQARTDRALRSLELHIGALGRRWGMMSESAFREELAGILSDEFGLQVEHYQKFDVQGLVFGQPDQVEIDVAIRNRQHILMELKASVSRNDVYAFQKKASFYRQEEGVEVKRMIIISPMLDPGVEDLARKLEIEIYTSAYDVQV